MRLKYKVSFNIADPTDRSRKQEDAIDCLMKILEHCCMDHFLQIEIEEIYSCNHCGWKNKKTDIMSEIVILKDHENHIIDALVNKEMQHRDCESENKLRIFEVQRQPIKPPKILIIHYMNQENASGLPLTRNIGGYKYKIRSAVMHFGQASYGHYACIVQSENGNSYLCDDEQVRPVKEGTHKINSSIYELAL